MAADTHEVDIAEVLDHVIISPDAREHFKHLGRHIFDSDISYTSPEYDNLFGSNATALQRLRAGCLIAMCAIDEADETGRSVNSAALLAARYFLQEAADRRQHRERYPDWVSFRAIVKSPGSFAVAYRAVRNARAKASASA